VEKELILQELKAERDRLDEAIQALEVGENSIRRPVGRPKGSTTTRRTHRLTPAGRKRLSEMMKKRWAARRKKTASAA